MKSILIATLIAAASVTPLSHLMAAATVSPDERIAANKTRGDASDDGFIRDDIDDRGRSRLGTSRKYGAQDPILCSVGIVSGLGSRDDFTSFFLHVPTLVLIKQIGINIAPGMQFMRSNSLNYNKGIMSRQLFSLKASGEAMDAGLSVRIQYHFSNPRAGTVSPFITAGPGYNFRYYHYSVKSALTSSGKREFVHSLTLHYGVGLFIRASERFRLSFDLNAISFFNGGRKGARGFSYDTTGAFLGVGVHYLI